METRNHKYSLLLIFEKYSVGKAANTGPSYILVNDSKLQWPFRDARDRRVHFEGKARTKLRAYTIIECAGFLQFCCGFG